MAPVTTKPTSTPSSGWEVILSSRDLRRDPATVSRPSPMSFMPNKNSPNPPSSCSTCSIPTASPPTSPVFLFHAHKHDENIMGMLRAC